MLSSVRFAFIFRLKLAYNQNSLAHYTKGNESPLRSALCSQAVKFQTIDPRVPPCTFPYGTLFTIDNSGLYPWVKVDLHYSDEINRPTHRLVQLGNYGTGTLCGTGIQQVFNPQPSNESKALYGPLHSNTAFVRHYSRLLFWLIQQGTKMVQFP